MIPDRWIQLTLSFDGTYNVSISHLEQFEEAYKAYRENENRPDKILEFTILSGDTLVVPVSGIFFYVVCSQKNVDRHIEMTREMRIARKAIDPDGD